MFVIDAAAVEEHGNEKRVLTHVLNDGGEDSGIVGRRYGTIPVSAVMRVDQPPVKPELGQQQGRNIYTVLLGPLVDKAVTQPIVTCAAPVGRSGAWAGGVGVEVRPDVLMERQVIKMGERLTCDFPISVKGWRDCLPRS